MSRTKLVHVRNAPVASGLPSSVTKPIKAELFAGKHQRAIGKLVGLTQFGVNHVTLERGAISALRHWHEAEDEFIYVLSGRPTLIDDDGEQLLEAGSCVGFPAGKGNAHHVVNRAYEPAVLLVVGSRRPGQDTVHYPDDALGPMRK